MRFVVGSAKAKGDNPNRNIRIEAIALWFVLGSAKAKGDNPNILTWSEATALWLIVDSVKAKGDNPNRKIRHEAPQAVRLAYPTLLPAASATNLVPDVLLCSPLEYIGEVERGILQNGQHMVSISHAQAFARMERSFHLCLTIEAQH